MIYFKNGWDAEYKEAGGTDSPNFHKSNALKTMRKRPELHGKLLAKGGWDFELIDELKPLPQDLVIEKPRYSGFFNTALDSMLRVRGIRNLVFVELRPMFVWNRPYVTASFWNILVSHLPMPAIRQVLSKRMKPVCITSRPFWLGVRYCKFCRDLSKESESLKETKLAVSA